MRRREQIQNNISQIIAKVFNQKPNSFFWQKNPIKNFLSINEKLVIEQYSIFLKEKQSNLNNKKAVLRKKLSKPLVDNKGVAYDSINHYAQKNNMSRQNVYSQIKKGFLKRV